jgi:anaerobic selenocysteine-containing dehydrogenase
MKRDKKDRGKADAWERITWDEAYGIIAENVAKVKKEYGPESIIVFAGTGREGGMVSHHGAHRTLGTPNGMQPLSGAACYSPRIASTTYSLGAPYPEMDFAGGLEGGYDDPRYKVPEVIMLWGKDPLPSNGDGLFGHAVIDLMRRGAKLIMVDPRINWLATRATSHLRVRPGTDAAMGMALLHVIISERLYDEAFVDKWCYGFEQLSERVASMPPEKAAEICDVPAENIYEAARLYAKADPATLVWGLAVDQNPNGVQVGQCILALMAITGNIDKPGGQTLVDITDGEGDPVVAGLGWRTLPADLKKKIIGLDKYPAFVGTMLQAQCDTALEVLETGEPYPIKLAWIGSCNPLAATDAAQPRRWYDVIRKLDFVFASDCWMTPTIQCCADVFLPLASYAEHDGVVDVNYGGSPNYMSAINKSIDVGETKGDYQIMRELGLIVNPEAWEGLYETQWDWINEYALHGTGVKFEQLREEVTHKRLVNYHKYEMGHLRPDGEPGFNTTTGRIELYSLMFEKYGDDPLPYFIEPPYSPISTPELFEEYPLILTTGARTYTYFHSEGRQIPYLREINPEPTIEINPETAKTLGIENNVWVKVENQFGSCLMKAKITPMVKPDTVMAQHGWWFPEEDGNVPHLYGVWRSNINNLMPHKHIGKLGFGAPYKCLICKVSRHEGEVE